MKVLYISGAWTIFERQTTERSAHISSIRVANNGNHPRKKFEF